MPTEIAITFPGVTGGSQLAAHSGWIDLFSFSQGIYSPADPTSAEGGSAGKSGLHEFSFGAEEGIHCVEILKKGTSGNHFATVQVDYIKQTSGADPEVYKTCIMEQVYITSYHSSKGQGVGTETWQMAAAKAKWEFFKQNAQGGLESIGAVTYDARSGNVA